MKRRTTNVAKPVMKGRNTKATAAGISTVATVDAIAAKIADDKNFYFDVFGFVQELLSNSRSLRLDAARTLIEMVIPAPGCGFDGSDLGKRIPRMWTTVVWSKGPTGRRKAKAKSAPSPSAAGRL